MANGSKEESSSEEDSEDDSDEDDESEEESDDDEPEKPKSTVRNWGVGPMLCIDYIFSIFNSFNDTRSVDIFEIRRFSIKSYHLYRIPKLHGPTVKIWCFWSGCAAALYGPNTFNIYKRK